MLIATQIKLKHKSVNISENAMTINEHQWKINEQAMKYTWESMNINANQWTSININEQQWTSMNKTHENQCTSMKSTNTWCSTNPGSSTSPQEIRQGVGVARAWRCMCVLTVIHCQCLEITGSALYAGLALHVLGNGVACHFFGVGCRRRDIHCQ